MGQQLQHLGLVPTQCAIKPHGSHFPFYFSTLLGSPNITVSNSRESKGDMQGGEYLNTTVNKTPSFEDGDVLQQT